MATGAPTDWYRTSFASDFSALHFEEGGEESARLAVEMLGLEGHERILDLACAIGGRSIELARRGFDVIGVDIRAELLEVAGGEADPECISPWFAEEDPRYLDYEAEFDVVLSLGGDQDLTRFDATLPPGVSARLAGVPWCPEAAIAASGHPQRPR